MELYGVLRPLAGDLPIEVRAVAQFLRTLVASLGIPPDEYSSQALYQPDAMQRYLDGAELPPRDVLSTLIHDLAARRGVTLDPEAERQAMEMYAAAVRVVDNTAGRIEELSVELDAMAQGVERLTLRERELVHGVRERQAMTQTGAYGPGDYRRELIEAHEQLARVRKLRERANVRHRELTERLAAARAHRESSHHPPTDPPRPARPKGARFAGAFDAVESPPVPVSPATDQTGQTEQMGGPPMPAGARFPGAYARKRRGSRRSEHKPKKAKKKDRQRENQEDWEQRDEDLAARSQRENQPYEQRPASASSRTPPPPVPEESAQPSSHRADPNPPTAQPPPRDPRSGPVPPGTHRGTDDSGVFATQVRSDARRPRGPGLDLHQYAEADRAGAHAYPEGFWQGNGSPHEDRPPGEGTTSCLGAARELASMLTRLRRDGRPEEAQALLWEAATWPPQHFPAVLAALSEAGLGSDAAMLLWELSSRSSQEVAAFSVWLVKAQRDNDWKELLTQAASRPHEVVASTVLALARAGWDQQVNLLLGTVARSRPHEEVADLAADLAQAGADRCLRGLLREIDAVPRERRLRVTTELRLAGLPQTAADLPRSS